MEMIKEFIKWLKTKPAEGEIDHSSWEVCAVGEFLAFKGIGNDGDWNSTEPGNPVYDLQQAADYAGIASDFLGVATYGEMLEDLTP